MPIFKIAENAEVVKAVIIIAAIKKKELLIIYWSAEHAILI